MPAGIEEGRHQVRGQVWLRRLLGPRQWWLPLPLFTRTPWSVVLWITVNGVFSWTPGGFSSTGVARGAGAAGSGEGLGFAVWGLWFRGWAGHPGSRRLCCHGQAGSEGVTPHRGLRYQGPLLLVVRGPLTAEPVLCSMLLICQLLHGLRPMKRKQICSLSKESKCRMLFCHIEAQSYSGPELCCALCGQQGPAPPGDYIPEHEYAKCQAQAP